MQQVFGPPLQALRRLRDRILLHMAKLSEFWRFLFLGPEPDEDGQAPPPARTSLLFASVILALALYSWPLRDILPVWLFIPIALVVLWFAWRQVQHASTRGSGHRWELYLRASERRVGLLWWERTGFLLAAAASVSAVILQASLLPLTLGVAVGFLWLLGSPPDQRELRRVRVVPPLPPLPRVDDGGAQQFTAEDGYVQRHFAWNVKQAFGTDSHTLTLHVHEPTVAHFKTINPGSRWDGDIPLFADYVVDGTTRDIERATAELARLSRERGYSTYEEISLALAMVQSIVYSLDRDSTDHEDYWRYPLETVFDETGDCEDTTLLAAALLRRMGHSVVTLLLPGHAALGVEVPRGTPGQYLRHEGRRMYYCETTASGWGIGEVPDDFSEAGCTVVPVPAYVTK